MAYSDGGHFVPSLGTEPLYMQEFMHYSILECTPELAVPLVRGNPREDVILLLPVPHKHQKKSGTLNSSSQKRPFSSLKDRSPTETRKKKSGAEVRAKLGPARSSVVLHSSSTAVEAWTSAPLVIPLRPTPLL